MENKNIVRDISAFRIYSIGIVAEDIKEDSLFVDVYPQENIPIDDGIVKKIKEEKITTTDMYNKIVKAGVNKTNRINCKWLAHGNSNRIYPPTVCKGEMVLIYRLGDTDKYYWLTFGNEIGLRKREKFGIMLSNKGSIGEKHKDRLKNTYYMIIDTINKFIRLHTDMSDGEAAMYDLDMDTKKGRVIFQDQKENGFDLDSVKSTWKFTALKELHFTTEKRTDTSTDEHTIVTKYLKIRANDTIHISTTTMSTRCSSDCTISAPNIDLNSEQTVSLASGVINNNAGLFKVNSKNIILDGNVKISGNLIVNGNVEISGTLTVGGRTI